MTLMKLVSRRDFLKTVGLIGAGALTWGAFPQLSHATSGNGTKVLFINLNGGLDGLYSLQPSSGIAHSTLATLRPTLCLNPVSLLDIGQGFGLHPNLPLFKSLFDAGKLTTVLGVGYDNMTRSHLDSEVVMARGVPDRLIGSKSGFLNRLGAINGWDSLHAVSVTGTDMAFDGGDYRGMQSRSLQDFSFDAFSSTQERNHLIATSYSLAHDATIDAQKEKLSDFSKNYQLAVNNVDSVRLAVQNHSPSVTYPTTNFGKALKDIDILFSSPELNTQVGYMRVGGFDTHSNQISVLNQLLQDLNDSLSIFVASMQSKALWNNLIVVVYSEFGRTNRENGSAGTDHGGANSVFLMGGPVNGGNIYGTISASELNNNGWLSMQYNVVEVYRRIIARLDLDPNAVFDIPSGASLNSLFN